MKKIVLISFLFVFVVVVSGCTNKEESLTKDDLMNLKQEITNEVNQKIEDNKKQDISNWNNYTSYYGNFSFKYPSDWQYYEYEKNSPIEGGRETVFYNKDGKTLYIHIPLSEVGFENMITISTSTINTNFTNRKLNYMLLESNKEYLENKQNPFSSIHVYWPANDKKSEDFSDATGYTNYWKYNSFHFVMPTNKSVQNSQEEIDILDQIITTFKFIQ